MPRSIVTQQDEREQLAGSAPEPLTVALATDEPIPSLTEAQKATLEDFYTRMPITKAAKAMGVKTRVLKGAIERGELEYIWFPGTARESVTPAMLAKWVQQYCTHRKQPIPA